MIIFIVNKITQYIIIHIPLACFDVKTESGVYILQIKPAVMVVLVVCVFLCERDRWKFCIERCLLVAAASPTLSVSCGSC